MYGYEGGSMIYRQDLERIRGVREEQKKNAFARLSNLEGQLKATSMVWQNAKWKALAEERDAQYRIALVTAGELQECEYLLKEIDLEEPSDLLIDPVTVINI
jgi:predicted mannosyl-3-phosphoglycerate phosphatase (HAD superfamily)